MKKSLPATMLAAATCLSLSFVPALADDNDAATTDDNPAVAPATDTTATTDDAPDNSGYDIDYGRYFGYARAPEYDRSPFSLELDIAYASAVKNEGAGGIDMGGIDLRFNYEYYPSTKISLSLLMLGGSDSIDFGDDLDSMNIAFLLGLHRDFYVAKRFALSVGVRAGVADATYTIDHGRSHGWDHYSSDSCICFAYAGEVGFTFEIDKNWSLVGGYSYYGNTASVGGAELKIRDQQYHMFHIGATYHF
ncbi:MAG: porin family protein [Opitutae bacterium]|nr:porin family protein [Opitutae bacterium]